MDSIVQSHREVDTCHPGEACTLKFSPGLFILKVPVLEDPSVDFSSDLVYEVMASILEERWGY